MPQPLPQEVGLERKVDHILKDLNKRWGLGLPYLHGREATSAEDDFDLSRKCSARLRALCRHGQVDIDDIVTEFEEKAVDMVSGWKSKPKQVSGTLMHLPRTKSLINKDNLGKLGHLPKNYCHSLVQALAIVLDDEYALYRDSDTYQRTSFPTSTVRLAKTAPSESSFQTALSPSSSSARSSSTLSSKRSGPQLSKREDRTSPTMSKRPRLSPSEPTQTLINNFTTTNTSSSKPVSFQDRKSTDTHTPPWLSSGEPVTSFTTTASASFDPVFSPQQPGSSTSNDTSFLSDIDFDGDVDLGIDTGKPEIYASTQFSVSTQFDQEILNDENIMRSLKESEEYAPVELRTLLEQIHGHSPLRDSGIQFPSTLPAWAAFELQRRAASLKLDLKEALSRSESTCTGRPTLSNMGREDLHEFLKAFCDVGDFKVPDWAAKKDMYCSPDKSHSVYFSAKLTFQEPFTYSLFDLKLMPIKTDKSNRLHREYGADRFLELIVPYFTPKDLPAPLKRMDNDVEVHNKIVTYLATTPLWLAGRIWRSFYIEKHESKSGAKDAGKRQQQRIHLFAVDGYDFSTTEDAFEQSECHRPIAVADFVSWHLRVAQNLSSSNLKLFSRMKLGLSKTVPTVIVTRSQFIEAPDIFGSGRLLKSSNIVMNDGCARISKKLATLVWRKLNNGKSPASIPSAFQGRISGTKGLWFVDYLDSHPDHGHEDGWIEVTPSQLKVQPHPAKIESNSDTQSTFEVVKYSTPCESARLNIQLVNILHQCGVTKSVFRHLIEADLGEPLRELMEAMHCPMMLRCWVQDHCASSNSQYMLNVEGDLPQSREEEASTLLESGFTPRDSTRLVKAVRYLLQTLLERYQEKLQIRVPHSTTVFCIADPYGILEAGTVQLSFSTRWMNPITEIEDYHLSDLDVLVARNPGALSSDIQKVKAVYHSDLRHLTDVIIFSTRGETPLADMLSGGDYDGDTVVVIWDPEIVDNFSNRPKVVLPSAEKCDLENHSQSMRTLVNDQTSIQDGVDAFLKSAFLFNSLQSKLGMTTNLHECLIYKDNRNMESGLGVKLAALNGYLVDAEKQGYYLNDSFYRKLQNLVNQEGAPIQPPYKSDNPSGRATHDGVFTNVIDHLKHDVIGRLMEKSLRRYDRSWDNAKKDRDPELEEPYIQAKDRSRCMNKSVREARVQILNDLRNQVIKFSDAWDQAFPKEEKSGKVTRGERIARQDKLQAFLKLFQDIRPKEIECDLLWDWRHEKNPETSSWAKIRAAYLYHHCKDAYKTWAVAFRVLCRIKAERQPATVVVIREARNLLKFDTKKFRKMREGASNDVDGQCSDTDEYYDCE